MKRRKVVMVAGLVLAGLGAMFINLVLHELGHACAIALVGVRIVKVEIGFNLRPRLKLRVRGCQVVVSPYLLCALVQPETRGFNKLNWWRHVVISLAGPGANVLLIIILLLLWHLHVGEAISMLGLLHAFRAGDILTLILFFNLLIAVGGALNLLPFPGYDGSRVVWRVLGELVFRVAGDKVRDRVEEFENRLENYAGVIDAATCLAIFIVFCYILLFVLLPALMASI